MKQDLEAQINNEGYFPIHESWSGEQILKGVKTYFKEDQIIRFRVQKIINSLNYTKDDWEMWEGGFIGIYLASRRVIKRLVLTPSFEALIMICVVLNTLVLTLEGLVSEEGE